ncbi:GGDEF domain-containing protein [Pseudorhizobium tarimense]|uniref:GGDEF domain-containing protein n=1 Tax=Pseudorhizobium tarimense TaxID=1079109 RepID=A0ABV2H8I2_9HYPH
MLDENWLRIATQAGLEIAECSSDMSICTRVVQMRDLIIISDLREHPELRHRRTGIPLLCRGAARTGARSDRRDILSAARRGEDADGGGCGDIAALRPCFACKGANCMLKISEDNLTDAAMRDPLTRFYNRLALEKIVDANLQADEARSELLGVLYLDMDGFKAINDTYGHRREVTLHAVADRIRQIVRGSDVVVRMGGDEFAIFMPELESRDQLKRVAERLRRSSRSRSR